MSNPEGMEIELARTLERLMKIFEVSDYEVTDILLRLVLKCHLKEIAGKASE